ncbi:uncharacterized protein LOC143197051 [Rhynchophorus ferrugineus]|uniref:uncharacterized protein LOC143197051 n=1 Tax=Rhynchophorus ferrugineus TaxID=354439 RepID=UPI003FCCDE2F
MESRWYLFSGQTLQNTKISDRVHALHITQSAWNDIGKHLDRKKIKQEAAERDAAVKKYLDEGSKNMTKAWENSLENVRRRKEEERLQLIEQKKDDRMQKFMELRKEQEEIRKQYRDKVKKQIFMTTGYARALTSALVTSEVIYEREKQVELQQKIKQHEIEEDRKYDEIILARALEEKEEKIREKEKQKEKQKVYGDNLKKIIKEKEDLEKTLKVNRIAKEAIDNIEAVREMEKLKKLQQEEKMREQKERYDEKEKVLKHLDQRRQQELKEEKELDEVTDIYQKAKHRIDCMRKDREKELRDIVVKRRDKIASMVVAENQNKTEVEEKVLKKAIAEKEAIELEKIKAKAEHQEKMKQERLQNIREVQEREEIRKRKEYELKKWELLNRFKTDEHTQKYEQEKRKKHWNAILQYRNVLLDQMEENRIEKLREEEIESSYFKASVEDEDAKFFEYANEVMELAKKKKRSIIPIERVIERYVKDMNIKNNYNNDHECKDKNSILKKKLIKKPKKKNCSCCIKK